MDHMSTESHLHMPVTTSADNAVSMLHNFDFMIIYSVA